MGYQFSNAATRTDLNGYLRLSVLPELFNPTLAVDTTQLNAALLELMRVPVPSLIDTKIDLWY